MRCGFPQYEAGGTRAQVATPSPKELNQPRHTGNPIQNGEKLKHIELKRTLLDRKCGLAACSIASLGKRHQAANSKRQDTRRPPAPKRQRRQRARRIPVPQASSVKLTAGVQKRIRHRFNAVLDAHADTALHRRNSCRTRNQDSGGGVAGSHASCCGPSEASKCAQHRVATALTEEWHAPYPITA